MYIYFYVKVWHLLFMSLHQELRNQDLLHIQDFTLSKLKGAQIITCL